MQITVFGASGRVGHHVVELLLEHGHTVVAFVHKTNPFKDDVRIKIIKGDTADSSAIRSAIEGSEAVISCLGSWGTPTKDILTTAMQSVVPAMEQSGPRRLISLTGVAAFMPNEQTSMLDKANRLLLKTLQPKILKDGEAHAKIISDSSLEWTIIRSPIMTSKDSATYRLSTKLPAPWVIITYKAVAAAMVEQLTDTSYLHAAPAIYPK